ncbi:MAG: enoyl-CoA hydratase/isomerase family protein [Deltaproteobacteria bacterium]|nr:enoyl-CoA hydratase/isomerase family protein [Deltaproteobacteria bacterium]
MSVVTTEILEDGRLVLLKLNRPKANILDGEMIAELKDEILSQTIDKTRALVISHCGPNFSFGASVKEHLPAQVKEMFMKFHQLFYLINELSIPTLAAVRGNCLGGGMELAVFCHFLFARPDSLFAQPEINLGVFPPMAALILGIKNQSLADDLCLSGRTINGSELSERGLITGLGDDPEKMALEFASQHLLGKSASSLRQTVKAVRWRINQAMKDQLVQLEKNYLVDLMSTHDASEGLNAFLDKRTPNWQDK